MTQEHNNVSRRFSLTACFRDTNGSYAVIFALAIVPILISIGAAIDLSQAYVAKQRLTSALDAAGLAVGGMSGQSAQAIQAAAQNYVNANYPISKIGKPGTVKVTTTGNKIALSAVTNVPTSFMGIIGVTNLKVAANSEITRMGKKLEVVLVLDTTGSMADNNKMATLKTAANNLIDTVSASAISPGDVKIAIVPFSVDVNVGTENVNANWLRWTWTTPKLQDCVTTGKGKKKTTTCSDKSYSIAKNKWTGCVGDRDMNWDVWSGAYGPTPGVAGWEGSLFPTDIDSCASLPLMSLTSDWTALKAKINSLTPAGNTNTTIGMVWGGMMLAQGDTLSNAAAPATNLQKVMIFLTDGTNTENRFTYDQDTIDERTGYACYNVKSHDVTIYTIRVLDGNETLLQGCASSPDKYYSVTNASQLTSVFATLAQVLSNLRVSG